MMLQVENSIWHAFDYLSVETGRFCASKSKLKVIFAVKSAKVYSIFEGFNC